MHHRLIEEFCDAINQWANTTNRKAETITFYAMVHLGAPWFVKAEGALSDPDDPAHRNKTLGEVHGRYTVAQLREYLIYLSDESKIFEDFLIVGLVHSITNELNELVVDYEDALARTRDEAAKLQDIYDHPNEHRDFLEVYDHLLSERGLDDIDARHSMLGLANLFWKMSHRPPDERAQRQSMLAAWKSITSRIISRDNLKNWRREYSAQLGLRNDEHSD